MFANNPLLLPAKGRGNSSIAGSSHKGIEELDSVVRWCRWTDGGAEFVFHDGTVFSFCNSMDTFVALRPSNHTTKPTAPDLSFTGVDKRNIIGSTQSREGRGEEPTRQLFVTSMTLSTDRRKVVNALDLFNRVSERPKLIEGLLPSGPDFNHTSVKSPLDIWHQASPIDSLLVKCDKDLLQPTEQGGWRLSCALKQTFLELPPNQRTFSVRWPAVVLSSDGTKTTFSAASEVSSTSTNLSEPSGNGYLKQFHPHSVRYVYIEQTFSSAHPPRAWQSMLEVMFELIAQRNDQLNETRDLQAEDSRQQSSSEVPPESESLRHESNKAITLVGSLPETLPTVLGGGGLAVSPLSQDFHNKSSSSKSVHDASLFIGGNTIRFSAANEHDANILAAEPLLFPARSMDRIHPLKTHRTYFTPTGTAPSLLMHQGGGDRSSSSQQLSSSSSALLPHSTDPTRWEVRVPQVDYYFDVSMGEFRAFPHELIHVDGRESSSTSSAASDGAGTSIPSTVCSVEVLVGEDATFLQLLPNGSAFKAFHITAFASNDKSTTSQDSSVAHSNERSTLSNHGGDHSSVSTTILPPLDPVADFVSKEYHIEGDSKQILPTLVGLKLDENLSRGRYLTSVCNAAVVLCRTNIRRCMSSPPGSSLGPGSGAAARSRLQGYTSGLMAVDGNDGSFLSNVNLSGNPGEKMALQAANPDSNSSSMFPTQSGAPPQPQTSNPHNSSHLSNITPDTVGLVKCSTRVQGVGVFTAYHDGSCRGVFDDRTIVTLRPDQPFNAMEGLVCTVLGADASLSSIRVVQCRPTHPAHPYLMYLMPFFEFSKLKPNDQLAFDQTGIQQRTFEDHSQQLGAYAASGSALAAQPPVGAEQIVSSHTEYAKRFQPAGVDVDALLYHTKSRLKSGEESSRKSRELLQQ